MNLCVELKKVIEEAVPGAEVQILDPQNDGTHLQAVVVSESFEGISLLNRHRQVMSAAEKYFSTSLHALEVKTYTPNEVKKIHE